MSILVVLLPIALFLGVGFTAAFVFAARSGQFDDMETPAHRVLIDDGTESSITNLNANQSPSEFTERDKDECRI